MRFKSDNLFFNIFSIISVAFNFKLNGIYISNALIVIIVAYLLYNNPYLFYNIIKLFLALVVLNISYYSYNHLYYVETVKITIIILSIYTISNTLKYNRIIKYFKSIPFIFLAYSILMIFAETDLFTYGGRFTLAGYGSSNTLAMIIVLNLGLLHFCSYSSNIKLLKYISIIYLIVLLFLTYSRGGLIAYIIGLTCVYHKQARYLILLIFVVGSFAFLINYFGIAISDQEFTIFERYNIYKDLNESGGSGRLFIWAILLNDLLQDVWRALIGFGPGSIYIYMETPGFNFEYISAHSVFMTVLYYYGFLGLGIFLTYLYNILRRVFFLGKNTPDLKKYLFGVLMFIFLIDATPLAAQALFFIIIFFSIILSENNNYDSDKIGSNKYKYLLHEN